MKPAKAMKPKEQAKKIRLICDRCRGEFYLKLPRPAGLVFTSAPGALHFKKSATFITLCPACQKEFDEMAPEE